MNSLAGNTNNLLDGEFVNHKTDLRTQLFSFANSTNVSTRENSHSGSIKLT